MTLAGAKHQIARQQGLLLNVPLAVAEYNDAPTADTDAFVAARATSTSVQVLTGAALNGAPIGQTTMAIGRNVTMTLSAHADFDAGTATVVGTYKGQPVSEDFTIPDAGNTTVVGVKMFDTVTQITLPVGSGVNGVYNIGFGAKLALPVKAKVRAGAVAVLAEVAVGAQVTTGTFVVPATAAPYGSYAPASAPDGTRDYVVYYERDDF